MVALIWVVLIMVVLIMVILIIVVIGCERLIISVKGLRSKFAENHKLIFKIGTIHSIGNNKRDIANAKASTEIVSYQSKILNYTFQY